MANEERGEVKIKLDKERTLKFTLNSLIYVEEQGINIKELGEDIKFKDMRTLLYAGLMHEDDSLTPEEVGHLINVQNMQEIADALNKAFSVGK